MRLNILVKPKSKEENILKVDEHTYVISVKSPALENKANLAVIKALAKHFKVSSANVRIVQGLKSRKKVVDVLLN